MTSVRESCVLERPAVLVVDAEDPRRRALSEGLAGTGYNVTPAMTPQEGLKFARGLGPSVIVGPVALLDEGDSEILEHCVPGDALERTILILGEPGQGLDLPDEVRFLEIDGLAVEEILRRIRLLLIGREVGVEADLELNFLVGDLSFAPFLELVRTLQRCRLTGRLDLRMGYVIFERGEVKTAVLRQVHPSARQLGAGQVRGTKAFCRMANHAGGPFRIVVGPSEEEADIHDSVPELVVRALEESQIAAPAPRTRLRVLTSGSQPTGQWATHQNLLLEIIGRCETVEELLDSVPSTDGRVVQALEKMAKSGLVKLERPKSGVTIVTDSTADLPPEMAIEHDIRVVPLSIHFGEDTLRDGVDIQPRDFYQMLESEEAHPTTSPPSEAELLEHFLDLIDDQDVLAVHISGKLSKTLDLARRAALGCIREYQPRDERKDFALELVDSQHTSMALGLLALFGARMAHRGERAYQIARRLEKMSRRIHMLFAVDTLEYLERGGRVGKAQAWVGKAFGIKPILGVVDGEVAPLDRVRGGRRAHPRIVKLVGEHVDSKRPLVACVLHARAPVWADRLRSLMEKEFQVREMITTDIGPTVGTHAGPGCVGTVVFQPTDEEWELVKPLE